MMEYSPAGAIKHLFNVEIGKSENKTFKNSIATLEGKDPKRGVLDYIKREREPGARNKQRIYEEKHLPWLNNVVVIQGFFPKPDRIKELLTHSEDLKGAMEYVRSKIKGRLRLGQICFDGDRMEAFYNDLETITDFKLEYLTNPFVSLPQLDGLSVIGALNHEADFNGDMLNMLRAYYQQDIESAYKAAVSFRSLPQYEQSPDLKEAVSMVERKYNEAIRFSSVLEIFN